MSVARQNLSLNRGLIYMFLFVSALVFLLPLIAMIFTSLKTMPEITGAPGFETNTILSLPKEPGLEAWGRAWSSACISVACEGLRGYFWNSIIMVAFAVTISVMLGAINGYVLSKWRFNGIPFTTLFFRNFYVTIPDALIQAARIDGAGFWTTFFLILIPVSLPIFVVAIIWQFTAIWNDFLFGASFSSAESRPLMVALNNLVNTSTGTKAYNVDMAGTIIAALPTMIVYIVGGRYFVRGLTAGAVKG